MHKLAANELISKKIEMDLARDYLEAMLICMQITINKVKELQVKAREIQDLLKSP